LSHPNILPFLGYSKTFSENPSFDIPALISPCMSNSTLPQYLGRKPGENKLLIGRIAKGISYLHENNIIQGNIRGIYHKCRTFANTLLKIIKINILVSKDGTPCITDFGLSRILKETISGLKTSNFTGCTRWMVPELFHEYKITKESDVWAFGMTILEVIYGQPPFYEVEKDLVVFSRLTNGRLPVRPLELAD
ncbi:hypothetical protein M422DRAFT_191487, partial [Sphaerobolus stellatus SS14]